MMALLCLCETLQLASCGQHVPMTLDERERLCELLRDIDDEGQDPCGPAATTGQVSRHTRLADWE